MMSETEQTINTAECVEIVRALVKAFEDAGQPLVRKLRHECEAESFLLPVYLHISTELVDRGLKALSLPYPEAPKPRKIPALPSAAQARVLSLLNKPEAQLKSWRNWNGTSLYHVVWPDSDGYNDGTKLAASTFENVHKFKWIEHVRNERGTNFYRLTDAGRAVLSRYQEKMRAPDGSVSTPTL